MNFLLAQ